MKVCKKISIILMVLMLASICGQCIIPSAQAQGEKSAIMQKIDTLAVTDAASNGAVTSTQNIAGAVISVAKVICAGVAIVMLTVIAMKYMLAAPSEKADIKKHAVVYVVGAVVMFAATGILTIIQNFASVLE